MFTSSLNPAFSFPKLGFHGFNHPRLQEHGRGLVKESKAETDVSPQKIVDLKVVGTLEKLLNKEGISLSGLEPEDFTPQSVSDRILSSVRQAYGQFRQSRPETDDNEFFSQVRSGLEQGFTEAKDILQSMGALQGQIADGVDETYGLTMQGVDQLESGLAAAGSVSNMVLQSVAMQSQRSAQMQIETQQGDLITISFNQSTAGSRSAIQASQSGQALSAYQETYTLNSELNISIEGDLNRDEQKALQHVMQNMHKISHAFFHGNEKAALKHAMKAGFDNQQIAGFSLDLSMRQSVQAVAAYQRTAMPEQAADSSLLAQAGDFLANAKAMLADAQTSLQTLKEPRQTFNDLFAEIGLLSNDDPSEPQAEADSQLLAGLIDTIGQNVFEDTAGR